MIRNTILLAQIWAFFLSCLQFSSIAQTTVDSKITAVTVYDKGAKVTRVATTAIESGVSTIVLSNVYHALQAHTMQTKIDQASISIMDVSFRKNHLKPPQTPEAVLVLEDSLSVVEKQIKWVRHQRDVINGEAAIIKAHNSPKDKNGTFEIEELERLTTFYRERLLNIHQQAMALDEENTALHEIKNRLLRQIRSMKGKGTAIGEIVIQLFSQTNTEFDVEISYLIKEAGWTPHYDLKSSGLEEPMKLTYRGAIFQKTGYDWEAVSMTLSSAQPTINNTQPSLNRMMVSIEPNYSMDTVLTFDPETYEEQVQVVRTQDETWSEVVSTPTSIQFELSLLQNIPSDGKEHFVKIQDIDLNADYEYFAIPRQNPTAFLVAKMADYGQYNLLPGNANLFFEGTYLGKTYIESQTVEDTLQVSLGRDLNIAVERVEKQFTAPKFIGGNVKETFSFVLKVRNNKLQNIQIQLRDQIPISTHKDLEVKLLQKGKASFDTKNGYLTWELDIPPNETVELPFSYSLKYPKGARIWWKH